jgi:hypothetical protein
MKKTVNKIAAILLIWAGGFYSCAEENNEYDDGIIPCNGIHKNDSIMELKNLTIKLYFLISYTGHAPTVSILPDNSIVYREGIVILNYTNSEGIAVQCYICNFPDYAIKWNPKNKDSDGFGDAHIEGKMDIIINGKVYIDSESEETISGTLELTSLKRKES